MPVKNPGILGTSPMILVYARLAPGVLEELRRVVPRRETGSGRKYPFTRRLTEDLGHPKLREHLASVTTIMRLSNHYDDFEVKLDLIHPRYDTTLPLPFYDEAAN
jgi:P63C domain